MVGPAWNAMAESETISKFYTGRFEHGLDDKRRIQVPSKWRPQAEGVEFAVVVWPKSKEGPCLRVLPPARFAKLQAELDSMPNTAEQKGMLKRFIGSNTEHVLLDKAGRMCLPEKMMATAGLKDKAVFVGCVDHMEIWSPEKYALVEAADAIKAEDAFKMME